MEKTSLSTNPTNIKRKSSSPSVERKEIIKRLQEHKWYRNTSPELKSQLTLLGEDYNGFLSDLAIRKDEFGGLVVLRLKKFLTSFKTILNIFEVRVSQTNQIVDYEYVSAKYGNNPGFKGILLLEIDNKIKYFIIKKSERFAVGGDKVYDTIGGFVRFKNGRLENFPKKVEDEIKRQIGLESLEIKRFIDLGLLYPNVGLESDHISLFAAVLNADNAKALVMV